MLITTEGKETIFFTLYYYAAPYLTDLSATLYFASLRSIHHHPVMEGLTKYQAGQTRQDSPDLTVAASKLG